MALKSIYEGFLQESSSRMLAEDATLNYITSATSYSQALPIARHLEHQNRNVVKIREASILSAVEGQSALVVEINAKLEFLSGGGAYLPGLDNMIAGKPASLPITHIVHFNHDRKITQIRISWDQATLLKQTDVIGRSGKNWPITDGAEQIKLIQNISAAVKSTTTLNPTPQNQDISRPSSPSKRQARDPNARLDLFEPVKDDETRERADPNPVEPRQSARPPPREMSDLFVAGHEDYEPTPANGGSPKKIIDTSIVSPKAGPRQHFQPVRLFDDHADAKSNSGYKTNPSRYNHFDIGDALEHDPMQYKPKADKRQENIPLRAQTQRPGSQWDFNDFVTPAKVSNKARVADMRTFAWDDQESSQTGDQHNKNSPSGKSRRDGDKHFDFRSEDTPAARPGLNKGRKDAENHFDFDDQSTPANKRPQPGSKSQISRGTALYRNNVYDEEDEGVTKPKPQEKAPLSAINNNIGRRNEMDSHWTMTDTSPAVEKAHNENQTLADDRKKAVRDMKSHWESYDQSPEQSHVAAPKTQQRKGMQSHWGPGNEEEEEEAAPKRKPGGRNMESHWDF